MLLKKLIIALVPDNCDLIGQAFAAAKHSSPELLVVDGENISSLGSVADIIVGA